VWARFLDEEEARALAARLGWPDVGAVLGARIRAGGDGSAKPVEVLAALADGPPPARARFARVGLWAGAGAEAPIDLFDLPALRALKAAQHAARRAEEQPHPETEVAP
jgi:hypothetical protein